jgi:hypothetical protein
MALRIAEALVPVFFVMFLGYLIESLDRLKTAARSGHGMPE